MAFSLIFFGLSLLPGWDAVLARCLACNAWISTWLLNLLGEQCHVSGTSIRSASYGITVESGCSAFEFAVFLCAAVFAFPSRPLRKILGVVVGVPILLAANLIRIASLFWIGVHCPAFFDTAHVKLWPGVLVVITVLVCVGWIHWITMRHEPAPV